jgi:very-short-patch-repair endonuclease
MPFQSDGRGSAGQLRIFDIMKKLYPAYKIIWEQQVEPINSRFDIFIKELGIVVEVDGTQHDSYNPLFHTNHYDMKKGFQADQKKDLFCLENGIKMIRLKYKDALSISEDGLKERIKNVPYPEGEYTFSCLKK